MIPKLIRFVAVLCTLFVATWALAQSSTSTGGIQGTISDPQGAVVPNAKVTVTNTQTGQSRDFTSSGSGLYNAGSLQPGNYRIDVESQGFPKQSRSVLVQVGVVSNGDVKLNLSANTSVEVTADSIAVDTSTPQVQGVLTPEQISNLPVDGRNFLNLAQLEPGVQLQDGQNFDPTKAGYSSVSFNGVNGRTARIELDGVDVSDETVGTTTLNISAGSIEEFQIARSTLDPSTEITSSGAINVSTRSGKNTYHGEGFGLFRDRRAGFANSPGGLSTPFQREQFGGSLGGAIIKDHLFFFVNSERVKQDQAAPLTFPAPFQSLSGGLNTPYRDTYSVGKLDGLFGRYHVFYRLGYEVNLLAANFGLGYAVYGNRDNTPAHAAGVDFTTGNFTHSIRFGYEKFHNLIGDLTQAGNYYDPVKSLFINVADIGLQTGPNYLAPQQTYQANHQIKYDGSKSQGDHIFRYGVNYNRIDGGGFASFFGLAPDVNTRYSTAVARGFISGMSDPQAGNVLAYPIRYVIIGNGQGYFTEKKSFGNPGGGQRDDRLSFYVGDNWKVRPTFTIQAALRYQRDTGRNDSDLSPIPCSAINADIVSSGLAPCSGSSPLLDQWGAGLGKRIRQPNTNFGPIAGFAWDVFHNGKTVIRGGGGIYYENSIFNNTLFDRPGKLPAGLFFENTAICGPFGNSIQFPNPNGTMTTMTSFNGTPISTLCGETIGEAGPQIAALQAAYQAAVKAAGPQSNPAFVGNALSVTSSSGLSFYSPNYRSPRSYQMNIGVQHELWKGGVITADYIRNIGVHFPLTLDANHVGAARYLNKTAALNAISATTSSFGCSGTSSAAIDCAIAAGASITDFAGNGLDSGATFLGGSPASINGLDPTTGAAFPGANPLVGTGLFQFYTGRSVYNALQVNFREQIGHSLAYGVIHGGNFEASYTLSRFKSNGGNDQNFSAVANDFDNPGRFFGPTGLDRTHQLSFGGVFDLKYGPRVSLISHFYSSLPGTFTLYDPGDPGAIFQTDVTGDGTVGDIVPGSNVGSFGRGVNTGNINQFISKYNSTYAGKLTPAGQALVAAGLFSQAQLVSLGAVTPTIASVPAHEYGNGILRTFDFRLSYPIKLKDRFHLEPSVGFFNLFNFSNFGNVTTTLYPDASLASPGSVQATTTTIDRNALRLGNGSGTFAQGSPREIEYGLRITF